MTLLQRLPQRLQRALLGAQQEVIHRRGVGANARQIPQAPLQPSTLLCDPALHPGAPTLVIARIPQQGIGQGPSPGIDRPRIAPLGPALQPLGLGNGVAQPDPGDSVQLGQAADHHQVGVLRHQGNQGLRLPARHQRQEGLVADDQAMARQERLEGLPAPELTGGVVGIGDPEHLSR